MHNSASIIGRRPGRALRWLGALLSFGLAAFPAVAGTLDKARESGKLTLGYRADARPFSYAEAGGKPAGYSVALCQRVADAVKAELNLPALAVDYVPVTAEDRFAAVQQGRIDLLCGAATPTLARRAQVDFSIPVFSAGIGALVRTDVARRLRDALEGSPEAFQPNWRATPGAAPEKLVLAAVGGTTIEASLIQALKARRLDVSVVAAPDYAAGVQMVLDRRAAALFGDRPVLLDAARRSPAAGELKVAERIFAREPLALAMRRDDDAFRLVVDRTLSRLFRSKDIAALYAEHFGPMDVGGALFYQLAALPE